MCAILQKNTLNLTHSVVQSESEFAFKNGSELQARAELTVSAMNVHPSNIKRIKKSGALTQEQAILRERKKEKKVG